MKKTVLLMIRDGWGISPAGPDAAEKEGNATLLAKTPFHEHLYATYPGCKLSGSGEDVGLPDGQMGNSEVGHLNLGAGRIVYQDITRINKSIRDGSFFKNPVLCELLEKTKQSDKSLHFIGLLSDGGVHSHIDHLVALLKMAKAKGLSKVFIHVITDGRDTSPTGGIAYIEKLAQAVKEIGCGSIATLIGRYYAMDRDKRWERTRLAYDLFVKGEGSSVSSPIDSLKLSYEIGKTDEFVNPLCFSQNGESRIGDGDGVVFFNFRADRARQLSLALMDDAFDGFERDVRPKIHYVTMTRYAEEYAAWGVKAAFDPQSLDNILGEILSQNGKTQCRLAETEKYPHVTYFFNGGNETPFEGEDRELVPSPKVATYDLQPEMSAPELTDLVIKALDLGKYDFIVLNFANPDMVGHTGDLSAAIKAVETIDSCAKQVIEKILELGGVCLVTADHGNCERMITPEGTPHTAHTTNLVHFLYVSKDHQDFDLKDGILADVAPTVLYLLGVTQPDEMTGHTLLTQK